MTTLKLIACLGLGLLIPARSLASAPSDEAHLAAERGIASYLATKYSESLPDLEKARDAGVSTGPLLYMLGFCYDTVRQDAEASKKAYDAAQEGLEKEVAAKDPSLESYFYLSNLYQMRLNADQSRKTAEAGIAAIESKRIKVGKDGTSQFRAGKLYADAGKTEPAGAYHRRALAAFSKMESPPPEYYKRALETVARADLGKGDPQQVFEMWQRLVTLSPHLPDGDWNLGLAALRASRYSVAQEAFQRARKQAGDKAEDAFYAAGLAAGGAEVVSAGVKVPSKDADGKTIASLDSDAIDKRIRDYSKRAGELLSRKLNPGEYSVGVNEDGWKVAQPNEKDNKEIQDIHRYFVALVSEILYRGLPLQSKAFQDGYASLVLQNWSQLWWNSHREAQEEVSKTDPKTVKEGS